MKTYMIQYLHRIPDSRCCVHHRGESIDETKNDISDVDVHVMKKNEDYEAYQRKDVRKCDTLKGEYQVVE